jgi:ribose-phosphate pyrophosphokinase
MLAVTADEITAVGLPTSQPARPSARQWSPTRSPPRGSTIEAAARLLRLRGAEPDIVVAATHGLLVRAAANCLRVLDLRRVLVTDTIPPKDATTAIQVCSIAPTLAEAIARLHTDQPLHEPLIHAR